MSTTVHTCVSVRGLLRRKDRELKGLLRDGAGNFRSGAECREWLLDRLSEGNEVLPFGEPCEGFDFKTGCPGHKEEGP